jgi:hypothetical protein
VRVTSLGFQTDLMVRRLAASTITEHDDHVVVVTSTNPGFWWGNVVILDRPLARGDAERLRDIFATELPGTTTMAVGIDGTGDDAGAATVLDALSLELSRDAVLTAEAVDQPVGPAAWFGVRDGGELVSALGIVCDGTAPRATRTSRPILTTADAATRDNSCTLPRHTRDRSSPHGHL